MSSISLKTENTPDGIVCTYADTGARAGIIKPILQPVADRVADPDMPAFKWTACGLGDERIFYTMEAAEYFVLTLAVEARWLKQHGYDEAGKHS